MPKIREINLDCTESLNLAKKSLCRFSVFHIVTNIRKILIHNTNLISKVLIFWIFQGCDLFINIRLFCLHCLLLCSTAQLCDWHITAIPSRLSTDVLVNKGNTDTLLNSLTHCYIQPSVWLKYHFCTMLVVPFQLFFLP